MIIPLDHPIFNRFYSHLETCGGCIGKRDLNRCKFARACAYVERASKGAITDSEVTNYPAGGSLDGSFSSKSFSTGTNFSAERVSDAGRGPCTTE